MNKIICGDCVKVLKTMSKEYVDLTVTSPSYDDLRTYKGYSFDFEALAKELFRVTKEGGVVVWVVGDQTINGDESGNSFKQALYFKEIGFKLHDTMIYEKKGLRYAESIRYYQCFEYMFVLAKGKIKTFNPLRDRENKSFGLIRQRFAGERGKDGRLIKKFLEGKKYIVPKYGIRRNIWSYVTNRGNIRGHPAQFPVKLAGEHILSWSNERDLVLDPMCGSGTTCKAAKLLKRNYIGIDISPDYCKLAESRLCRI